ncbi:MAG: ASKHA domain-containing protein [Limisphaerales bacterium]
MPRVELFPTGRKREVRAGKSLKDVLFEEGVEFPCGGNGRCRGCRVKLVEGHMPVTAADERSFSAEEIQAGWRLACQATVQKNLKLEIAQWELSILGDDNSFSIKPKEGFGIAVDLGTTTIVAQLVDLQSGNVLASVSSLNAQAQHGSDLMSRIEIALQGGTTRLTALVRDQVGAMVAELSMNITSGLRQIVVVGNTVMHHLFSGLSVVSLAEYPFQATDGGLQEFDATELGWSLVDVCVSVLPCLGGFVGSDLLAGIFATQLHLSAEPIALIDLGTNGEIIVGNRHRILCASTAAGPAFEGARIRMGMRAAQGAISKVWSKDNRFECEVLGGGEPRGICGSGLVDVVAVSLDRGAIQPSGRFAAGASLHVSGAVSLTQHDIRELQLAKGAIAAGLQIVAAQWGIRCDELAAIYLGGAFGNYMNVDSARRIGLLPFAPEEVISAGNAALRGAKMALFREELLFTDILSKVEHVPLNEDSSFQKLFVQKMLFPEASALMRAA